MKFLLAVVLFVAAAQAKSVSNSADLEFIFPYVETNPRHTAEEWDAIYAAAEADVPENTTGLVLGTEPQPEDAGKVFVKPHDRIIQGSAASQGQFPWQALLILGGTNLCGGSLISTLWVVTAAHCTAGHSTFHVTLGSTSRTVAQAGSVSQNARQAINHASYNSQTYANDIAVVKLSTAVALNNHVNVVRLASGGNTYAGSSATVSGFGRISSTNQVASANLLYINVEIITNAQCARSFGTRVLASNICSLASGGKSPCNGDSGGPLVVGGTLVGAVSFGGKDCPANTPTAYARITSFLSWISSHTGVAVRD